MTHVTCRLTAKNRDQLLNPTLGDRVWATFTFLPTRRRRKPAGIDTERNYVTVTLCVLQTALKEIIVESVYLQNYATMLHCRLQNDDNSVKQPWRTEERR